MRHYRALVAAAVAVIGAITFTGTAASAAPLRTAVPANLATGAQVQNWYSGLGTCLDAESDGNGNPYQNGDHVQIWACLGNTNQQWTFHASETYTMGTITNDVSGKCLDAINSPSTGQSPANEGDLVQLWACNNSSQQNWEVIDGSGGSSVLVNGYAGLVLDAQANANDNPDNNGDPVQLWGPRKTASGQTVSNQEWSVSG